MKAYKYVLLTSVIVISTGFIGRIGASCPCNEEGVPSMKNIAISQCSRIHQITHEAYESIVSHKHVPDDHEVKCWLSCVMDKLGMIKGGKIDWEHCKNLLKHDLTSEMDKAKVDEIAEICLVQVSQDEKDECQLAYSVAVCQIDNWKKLGLPEPSMKK